MVPEVSPAASIVDAFGPDDPPPTIVTLCRLVVMSRSPVAAAFSWVALVKVRLYVVAGCRLITTGSALRSAFAAMIAPRRLQSLGAPVQAVAAAVSSARSTVNVVVNGRNRLEGSRTAPTDWLDEFEDTLWV